MIRVFFSDPARRGPMPGIFLDRDGVINEKIEGSYVTTWEEFRYIDGVRRALLQLSALGLPLIVVSNQAAVGKGLISEETLVEITRRFVSELREAGVEIQAVYYCPHVPQQSCACRKPQPGLLEQAAREWNIDLRNSVMIGDSLTDAQAATAAGCRAVLFSPAKKSLASSTANRSDLRVAQTPAQLARLTAEALTGPG
jgi:D-glycero-D-manno-heptose 1,7-bisphosphate phosphatase